MPKIVPVKNVDQFLVDVKRPDGNYQKPRRLVNLTGFNAPPFILYRRSKSKLSIIIAILLIIILGGGFFGVVNFKNLAGNLEKEGSSILSNFSLSIKSLKEFQPAEAAIRLRNNDALLANLEGILDKYGGSGLIGVLGTFIPGFKQANNILGDARRLNKNILSVSELLDDLKLNAFHYLQNDGLTLLSKLKDLRNLIEAIVKDVGTIQNSASALKNTSSVFGLLNKVVSEQYIAQNAELYRWKDFLNGLISFLDSREDVHLLLLFQNPSEIRPAGGFIGSYADVILRNGQLYFIDVRDIYDPEGQLELKVIPPESLQVTTHIWGARDANWFFDFPTSAAKVVYFLENSKLYKEQGIEFKATVALNINVIENILGLIGPIPLGDYNLVIDENNFLKEVQREVESGDDKKAGYPKRILKILTPIILERVQLLNDGDKEKFAEIFFEHFENKDVMIFAKDKILQDFFVGQGVGGAVYNLSHNFFGAYLAVVNANIEGGKSDTFMDQELNWEITLNVDGSSFNNLTVKRTHSGNKEKELWWRKTNQNYIQVFANAGARLVSVKGNNSMPAKFKDVNYELLKYTTDPDVKRIEDKNVFINDYKTWTGEAFGKTVFGTWFNVAAGQSKEMEIRYQTLPPFDSTLSSGRTYQFIYEKQSGVEGKITVKINAPYGYIWGESQSPVYGYESDISEGRFIINLTLVKR